MAFSTIDLTARIGTEIRTDAATLVSGKHADTILALLQQRGVLIGATFAGADVSEMLQSATIAIVGEVPISRLWHAVPSYPTISEVWLRLLDQLR